LGFLRFALNPFNFFVEREFGIFHQVVAVANELQIISILVEHSAPQKGHSSRHFATGSVEAGTKQLRIPKLEKS
jgi:hypothetical protein